jgi:D-xylose reductase
MLENAALFDFTLSQSEMDAISALNQNRRFNDPGVFCEAAFNRFHPIYD